MIRRFICKHRGHTWNHLSCACTRCHLTMEAIEAGRDKRATWTDVDAAYEKGFANGHAIGRVYARKQRHRYVQLGFWICLRRLKESIG